MEIAYVLFSCDLGFEEQIIEDLKKIDEVKDVHGLFAIYDIIAKIESDSKEHLNEIISRKIRKIDKVGSTLTLMVTEKNE